jgi:ribonuclease E
VAQAAPEISPVDTPADEPGESVQDITGEAPLVSEPEAAAEAIAEEAAEVPDAGIEVEAADSAPVAEEAPADVTENIAEPEDSAGMDRIETVPEESLPPETIGGESDTSDSADDMRERRLPPRFLRNYKIQEVIRRRQILLVQVVKEERGSKGAALTTYISLAGRFCVLMPNSPRGGGISRKITSAADRRRLKEITSELDIPTGMGLIVRTAGANRPKPEIRRDCEYLLRLWDDIRETTMRSVAPALIYEEASLIKRAIRDVYSRDVDEVVVDGEDGWRAARDFMQMLMPSHARKVIAWRQGNGSGGPALPLFAHHQVEAQLDAMLAPNVQLRSGGYLVINQAEALVAIDVNSGRSTRERGIEETALRTNLEAADEVARQLRLRDLAGLIVIDFIDMESKKHNAMVERRLKEALKNDRARIQVGHISHFGLMEMSRQRLRPSLTESSFVTCMHCGGIGIVRSTESAAIHALRDIEEEGAKRRSAEIMVSVSPAIAMYILNYKRDRLAEIEQRFAMRVAFTPDASLVGSALKIDRLRARPAGEPVAAEVTALAAPEPAAPPLPPPAVVEVIEEELADDVAEPEESVAKGGNGDEAERKRRRRRRRRGARRGDAEEAVQGVAEPGAEQPDIFAEVPTASGEGDAEEAGESGVEAVEPDTTDEPGGRRRGRRGGRRRRREVGGETAAEISEGVDGEAPAPYYTGPTPADPFGSPVYDIFDVIEQAEQMPPPHPVLPLPMPEAAPEPVAEPGAELGAEPLPEPVAADVAPEPVPEAHAEPQAEPPAEPAEPIPPAARLQVVEPPPQESRPEPATGPVIKPMVIDGGAPAQERKRGWWRR